MSFVTNFASQINLAVIKNYLKSIKFCGYLISRFGDCKTFQGFLISRFQWKWETKVSLNTNFSIVNQCNYYQIWYRNSNFVTISRDMRYKGINMKFDQVLGKRESQTRPVFSLLGI